MPPRPTVIAHRGVHSDDTIENTLRAFELAVEAGADMIEFDVRRSRDGELVVLHDASHMGVALDSCSFQEFKRRSGFSPPLLADVLGWAVGKIAVDVELKEDGYADELMPILKGFANVGGELLITSFLDPVLAHLSGLDSTLRLGLLLEFTAMRAVERAQAVGASTVLPNLRLASETLIAELHDAGLEVVVWDVIAADNAEVLADRRVAGVITDDVPGALAVRAALTA